MIDDDTACVLGSIATITAEWLKDNGATDFEIDMNVPLNVDEHGFRVLATGYMRLWYELVQRGIVKGGRLN